MIKWKTNYLNAPYFGNLLLIINKKLLKHQLHKEFPKENLKKNFLINSKRTVNRNLFGIKIYLSV